MKYTIEAIENAKPGMKWDEIGCHWTLGQAYLYSKEAGNDLPNFAEVIWDDDIEAILSDCRKLGAKEQSEYRMPRTKENTRFATTG